MQNQAEKDGILCPRASQIVRGDAGFITWYLSVESFMLC